MAKITTSVFITNATETIELNEKNETTGIKEVKFIFDSPDEIQERALDSIRGLELKGKIDNGNKDETLKLAKWALATESQEAYREVNVVVEMEDEIVREYKFSKTFVVDYTETIGEDNISFVLRIHQKAKETEVKVFA